MNDLLNSTHAWGLILGVLSPLLVSVVQQPKFTGPLRAVVALASAVVIGLLTVLAAGDFNPTDWLTTAAVVLVAAHTAYEGFWRPTGIAEEVEYRTSPSKNW